MKPARQILVDGSITMSDGRKNFEHTYVRVATVHVTDKIKTLLRKKVLYENPTKRKKVGQIEQLKVPNFA